MSNFPCRLTRNIYIKTYEELGFSYSLLRWQMIVPPITTRLTMSLEKVGRMYVLSFGVRGFILCRPTGCYQYCKQGIYCYSCVRQVYVQAARGKSSCVASFHKEFDCRPRCFERRLTVPTAAGIHPIRVNYMADNVRGRAGGGAGVALGSPLLGNLLHTFDCLYERIHSRRRNAHQNMTFSEFLMHSQPF